MPGSCSVKLDADSETGISKSEAPRYEGVGLPDGPPANVNADEVIYCPRCGTLLAAAERFGKQRPLCPNCGWIYFADPKVAVAVLLEERGRVLLVRRANDPFRGLWTLPAGFVDAGEDPARAAERECLEETGLIVRAGRVRDVLAGQEHPRGADFIIIYDATVLSGQLSAGDDADAADWFDNEHLPPLAFNSTAAVLRPSQRIGLD